MKGRTGHFAVHFSLLVLLSRAALLPNLALCLPVAERSALADVVIIMISAGESEEEDGGGAESEEMRHGKENTALFREAQ